MSDPKKKRDRREGDEPRKQPGPQEPQKRENPDERRPEEWDPGGEPT